MKSPPHSNAHLKFNTFRIQCVILFIFNGFLFLNCNKPDLSNKSQNGSPINSESPNFISTTDSIALLNFVAGIDSLMYEINSLNLQNLKTLNGILTSNLSAFEKMDSLQLYSGLAEVMVKANNVVALSNTPTIRSVLENLNSDNNFIANNQKFIPIPSRQNEDPCQGYKDSRLSCLGYFDGCMLMCLFVPPPGVALAIAVCGIHFGICLSDVDRAHPQCVPNGQAPIFPNIPVVQGVSLSQLLSQ